MPSSDERQSPAQRYASARRRAARDASPLGRFAASMQFPLDPFQERACDALQAGRGVLVAAPTGAGKTVVGEFAVHLALSTGTKAFYTTPIKALSNQKYSDLAARYGPERVGLLTGDASINGDAPVVVMTTEVLRNMLYTGSPALTGLEYVVMDEVHYLADRFRGAVWEEVIIHLPRQVRVVSLSATVSNAEEFGAWLSDVRGGVDVVVSEERPVPLWQHVLVGHALYDLFRYDDEHDAGSWRINPELRARIRAIGQRQAEQDRFQARPASRPPRGGRRSDGPRRRHTAGPLAAASYRRASRADVVTELDREGLLPAITFVFSRVGCDAAVGQLLARQLHLVPPEVGERNRRSAEKRVAGLSDADLAVLGYGEFSEGLSRGFAAHHAGMLPPFREIVEDLFVSGGLRAVFATETLALGINMPARTVVLEKLTKFNGETHADITATEYTQLTGRAGRRGIDVEGHAVVLWDRSVEPEAVAGLAATRTFPLLSSFRPTYNMTVNLVGRVGRARAREVLETSFAQFQADRSVVGLNRRIREADRTLRDYATRMRCELGDFQEYAAIRRELSQTERAHARQRSADSRAAAAASLEVLRPGDVIDVPAGRRPGFAVVVAAARTGQQPSPSVVTADRQLRRLNALDVPTPVTVLARVRVPKNFQPRSPKARRDLAATLRVTVEGLPEPPPRSRKRRDQGIGPGTEEVADLRRRLRHHPCHACPDREEHAQWAQRWWRLHDETDGLQRQVDTRSHTVARLFDRICDLLAERGYLDPAGERVTETGAILRRLYTERDLLVAECLVGGAWDRLDPPGLAAVVSCLVYEPRPEDRDAAAKLPSEPVRDAFRDLLTRHEALVAVEAAHGLRSSAAPDAGMTRPVHQWARGHRLDAVLRDSDLSAGDFVRRCKGIVDLLGQIADAASGRRPTVADTARRAADAVLRGVVAADRLD